MSTITLSERVVNKAKEMVDRFGYPSVEAYIEDLVNADSSNVPSFSNKDELKSLIEEGLASPVESMSDDDWNELRRFKIQ